MGFDKEGDELTAAATQWLVALDSGSVDPQTFESWRAADPRHAAAFAQVLATWERTGSLRLSPQRPDAAAGEAGTGDEAGRDDGAVPHPQFTRRRLLAGGGLALLAAGTVSGALLLHSRESIATEVGERRTIRLPDGSFAELNTDSRLSWEFGRTRKVWLERGEVALSVTAAGVAPFLLHTGNLRASLSAGRYNSRLFGDGPVLTAFNGGGEVRGGASGTTRLQPMHALSERGGALRTGAVSQDDADATAAWRRGEIVFNGMTLDKAVDEFNRYLDRKLVIGDPALGSIRLGGRFFVDDPDAFLRALRMGFDIGATPEADRIVLHLA